MIIGIDLGHGVGQDRGANGIISEENIINEVGNRVINKLRQQGHRVVICRPSTATNVTNSLAQRCNIANANNCNLFISIHANAFNGTAYGTEIYTYGGKKIDYAVRINNKLAQLGFTNRGIKDGSNLYVIRNTKMSAMLIEVCFCDSQKDINIVNKVGYEGLANAIVSGITNMNITTQSQPTNNTYRVKVTCDVLNVRSQPNTNSKITTTVKRNEVYTIVQSSGSWGKLKSGAGWIHLGYTKRI